MTRVDRYARGATSSGSSATVSLSRPSSSGLARLKPRNPINSRCGRSARSTPVRQVTSDRSPVDEIGDSCRHGNAEGRSANAKRPLARYIRETTPPVRSARPPVLKSNQREPRQVPLPAENEGRSRPKVSRLYVVVQPFLPTILPPTVRPTGCLGGSIGP